MKVIVAVAKDWGIGKEDQLLARNKEDMKFFRTTTSGQVVIMGRRTLESFPGKKPLPNRENIVITGDVDYEVEGAMVVHSIEEACDVARMYEKQGKEVYVCGGESIYRQMLPYVSTAYVTKMDQIYEADTYFPNLDQNQEWMMTKQGDVLEYTDGTFHFCTYEKK